MATSDMAGPVEIGERPRQSDDLVNTAGADLPADQCLVEQVEALGHGEFTRAQWEHMSKRDRRARVLDDLNPDDLTKIVERLHASPEAGHCEEAGT